MGILDLNTYGSNTVNYTDNRSPDVIFTTPGAFEDLDLTYTTLSFPVEKSKEIYEIINPASANVSFEIDISAVAGATLAWSSVPAGCTVTNAGGVYTIDGIDSTDIWDIVKEPTITVPSTFNGSFFYYAAIRYTTSAGATAQEWQVGTYIPTALCSASSSISCSLSRTRTTGANLNSECLLVNVDSFVSLFGNFGLEVNTIALNPYTANLTSTATLDYFQPLNNISNLTYLSNQSNAIFESPVPYLRDNSPGSSTFEVTFTVSSGVLSDDDGATTSSSLTLSGTFTSVNSQFENVIFYPPYGTTSTVELDWTVSKDASTLDSGTTPITYAGAGAISDNLYSFTSSGTLSPTYEEIEYGKWQYLIVGGGGGGAAGGGGAGGQVLTGSNQLLSHTTYSVTVGGGGSAGAYSFNWVSSGFTQHGGTGGSSSALGFTAQGGVGGRSSAAGGLFDDASPGIPETSWYHDGGSTLSTTGATRTGGLDAPVPANPTTTSVRSDYLVGVGGGGAGAGANGGNASLLNYIGGDTDFPNYRGGNGGNDVASSITGSNLFYGGGGGGGQGYNAIDGTTAIPTGGNGGGGDGFAGTSLLTATQGTDNRGGGGGGGGSDYVSGPETWKAPARGGKGVVHLKVIAR